MTTVLFQSVPPQTLLTLDLISLTASPAFQGIRRVPPGLHFVLTGTDAGLSVRNGVWFQVPGADAGTSQRNIIFQWIPEEEHLVQIHDETSPAVLRGEGFGLRDQLGGGLVDYGFQNTNKDFDDNLPSWQSLTQHINMDTLNRILLPPQSSSSSPTDIPSWTITSTSSSIQDLEPEIPNLSSSRNPSPSTDFTTDDPSTLNLIPIDLRRTWPSTAIGRSRTLYARDRSWALSNLFTLAAEQSPSSTSNMTQTQRLELGAHQLLSELQFCFLMVLLLGNFSCFEQWKRITGLIFTCKQAVREIEGWFILVLKVLEEQIRCLGTGEGGMFEAGGLGMMEEVREEFASGIADGMLGGGAGLLGGGEGRMRKLLMGWQKGIEEEGGGGGDEKQKDGDTNTGHLQKSHDDTNQLKQEIGNLWRLLKEEFGWEDEGITVLKRGMVNLEDGEQVELEVEGADEDEELGEYAPVVVDLD
ncbi:putative aar2 family protein [Phaeomoniella chlamydospora]|uniref:Putative aar2 family protein n=1 Tax=Phaeomoniella chlamydospora TaxID=158046 RepID=A0A0G2FQU7_PHACM|nr:putative aar2 family protein [Phaeomoniella chlamydospora]